jgi:short-subunit dehydrogenase
MKQNLILLFSIIVVDLSTSYDKVEKELLSLEDEIGPVYMLVNCAGTSICSKLEDSTPTDIEVRQSLCLHRNVKLFYADFQQQQM